MNKREVRFLSNATASVQIRAMGEGKPEMMGGMAAVFYDGTPATEYVLWEYGGERAVERILPGAFDKVMEEKQDVACLFNHNPDAILGRTSSETLSLSVDAKGLMYECQPGETGCAKDVMEHLRRKDVTGSSFSFEIGEQRWTEIKGDNGAITMIREVVSVRKLWDVGPVTWPAYTSTTAGVRSGDDTDEAKKSLAQHLKGVEQQRTALTGKLAAYQARARAAEVSL